MRCPGEMGECDARTQGADNSRRLWPRPRRWQRAAQRVRAARASFRQGLSKERLFGGGLFVRLDRLYGWHGHEILGPDFARDDGDVHLAQRLAVLGVLAADENRRARLERPAEHEVRQR